MSGSPWMAVMTGGGEAGTVAAAALLGVTGSLHCLAMCGPLAASAGVGGASAGVRGTAEGRWSRVGAYQLARLGAYTVVGALLGSVGGTVAVALTLRVRSVAPWLLAAALLASALELGKRLPPIPPLSRLAARLIARGARFAGWARAGAIGAATPLLPCGLLYGGYLAALASGSTLAGAQTLGAFAAGGMPALFGAQLWLARVQSPRLEAVLRRGLPALAALVLVVRAVMPGSSRCH